MGILLRRKIKKAKKLMKKLEDNKPSSKTMKRIQKLQNLLENDKVATKTIESKPQALGYAPEEKRTPKLCLLALEKVENNNKKKNDNEVNSGDIVKHIPKSEMKGAVATKMVELNYDLLGEIPKENIDKDLYSSVFPTHPEILKGVDGADVDSYDDFVVSLINENLDDDLKANLKKYVPKEKISDAIAECVIKQDQQFAMQFLRKKEKLTADRAKDIIKKNASLFEEFNKFEEFEEINEELAALAYAHMTKENWEKMKLSKSYDSESFWTKVLEEAPQKFIELPETLITDKVMQNAIINCKGNKDQLEKIMEHQKVRERINDFEFWNPIIKKSLKLIDYMPQNKQLFVKLISQSNIFDVADNNKSVQFDKEKFYEKLKGLNLLGLAKYSTKSPKLSFEECMASTAMTKMGEDGKRVVDEDVINAFASLYAKKSIQPSKKIKEMTDEEKKKYKDEAEKIKGKIKGKIESFANEQLEGLNKVNAERKAEEKNIVKVKNPILKRIVAAFKKQSQKDSERTM